MESLNDLRIDAQLLRGIAEIDEFKGRWEVLGNLSPERLTALERIATIESIGSSTRIEGAGLSDDEVERLLSGLDVRSFRSRDEQEVAGYADAMELIFEFYSEIGLTENHIRQLHGVLLKHSDKDAWHRGHYKKLPNNVEAFDESGRSIGVIFETTAPFDTPRKMQELVESTRSALEGDLHHPLLVVGSFVVRFLAIHPFQDGNGRLSRVLTTLLMLRAGYGYVPYSSLERVVEENKDAYYLALRRAQASLDGGESQLDKWISFFVKCLTQQKNVLLRKLDEERLMAPLSPLSEKILGIVRQHGRVTVRDAASLTGANRNTIKVHLTQLVRKNRLVQRGRGRGTWYERNL